MLALASRRQQRCRPSAVVPWLLGILGLRWLHQHGAAWVAASSNRIGSGLEMGGGHKSACTAARRGRSPVACSALGPLIRRDYTQNRGMKVWTMQQLRLEKRRDGLSEEDTEDKVLAKKIAYLNKLGLTAKAKALEAAARAPVWHLSHMAKGDVFRGWVQHPKVAGEDQVDIEITMTSDTQGYWYSDKAPANFDGEFEVQQDFPIVHEQGEAREEAMVAYIFNKFNSRWMNLDEPVPAADEMEHLSLGGLRLFFYQVAEAENFPPEEEFNQAVEDPSKGMTKAEFLKYIKAEDENYLEKSFGRVFRGRRVRFSDGDTMLDGDFEKEIQGKIWGFLTVGSDEGGTFSLNLVKS